MHVVVTLSRRFGGSEAPSDIYALQAGNRKEYALEGVDESAVQRNR